MSKKILLIGNGFDLAHGLPTRWENFKDYLEVNISSDYKNLYCSVSFKTVLKKYIDELNGFVFWSDVEGYLGKLGEECQEETEIVELHDFIKEFTLLFQRYLLKVEEELFPKVQVSVDTTEYVNSYDTIITTNYTNTLEKLYGVPHEKVLHIHGQINEYSLEDITCIIGCDNSSFNNALFNNISPRKVGNLHRDKPNEICSTKISKLGLTMSMFNSTEFMTDNCTKYEEAIKFIEDLKLYISSLGESYEMITFWGYSFGVSDYILNKMLLNKVKATYQSSNQVKFISYSNDKFKRQFNEEIQVLVEDKLGYNSKDFKTMIDFSENYVHLDEKLHLS